MADEQNPKQGGQQNQQSGQHGWNPDQTPGKQDQNPGQGGQQGLEDSKAATEAHKIAE